MRKLVPELVSVLKPLIRVLFIVTIVLSPALIQNVDRRTSANAQDAVAAVSAQRPVTTARPSATNRLMNTATATVSLPAGLQFMYIIPAEEAEKMRLGRPGRGNIYVTYEVRSGDFGLVLTSPRLIRFLQAGSTPGSWDEVLYIQER